MLCPMSEYVKADRRRAQARAAAMRLLSSGQMGYEGLALRHVAQEMDVPLSTLTYAYPSVGVLFEDLADEAFQFSLWDSLRAGVGSAGLRSELLAAAGWYLEHVLKDEGMLALIVWQLKAVARGQWSRAEFTSDQAEQLIDQIARSAGEHYRVPHDVLGNLVVSFVRGQVMRWVELRDERVYWSTMLAGIDGTVLLADPRPSDQPHPVPPPMDYGNDAVPARA